MDYVRLGSSALRASRIGFGGMSIGSTTWRSWVLNEAEAIPLLEKAIDAGINFIDTCNFYSAGASESLIGALLSRVGRQNVILATKVGNPVGTGPNGRGYSRKHIIEAVEGSLRRLRTDYIDVYQNHIWDPDTNLDELSGAFDHLIRQGKVLYIGATDIPCYQLAKLIYDARAAGRATFATLQFHYNAVWREAERELLPLCRQEGLGLLPYSPLARGFLAGRERRLSRNTERARTDTYTWDWYGRPEDARVAEVIETIATDIGATAPQVALAWVSAKLPASTQLVGFSSVTQLDEALRALALVLEPEQIAAIDIAYAPRWSSGHF
jgi:aryl-alcohol dehydrogenase-like predicted oxidoreductase